MQPSEARSLVLTSHRTICQAKCLLGEVLEPDSTTSGAMYLDCSQTSSNGEARSWLDQVMKPRQFSVGKPNNCR